MPQIRIPLFESVAFNSMSYLFVMEFSLVGRNQHSEENIFSTITVTTKYPSLVSRFQQNVDSCIPDHILSQNVIT